MFEFGSYTIDVYDVVAISSPTCPGSDHGNREISVYLRSGHVLKESFDCETAATVHAALIASKGE